MENNFCINSQLILKAKFDAWSDYTTISEVPRSFLELVKIFSTLLYPNNFSISYIDTNMNIQTIENDDKYREAVLNCMNSKNKEMKLMMNVYKDKKLMNVDKSIIKRNSLIKHSDIIIEESQSEISESESTYTDSEVCRKNKRRRSRKTRGLLLCF